MCAYGAFLTKFLKQECFTLLKNPSMLSFLQLGWNKVYMELGVQEREAGAVGIIQTQMIAFRVSVEWRRKNMETLGLRENISILKFSGELPFTSDTTDRMTIVYSTDRSK